MPRQHHDPFTDAPLRPTNSNASSLGAHPSLRSQTSQHSLQSNASTTSSRAKQPHNLFAPSLMRRAATPKFEDEVFADSDSEQELGGHKQRQTRRTRLGSPQGKHERVGKNKQGEEQDFVNRQPDGSYLLGVAGFGDTMPVPQMTLPKSEEELDQDETDAHYGAVVREYFSSGASVSGKSGKKHEEDYDQHRLPIMIRLREQAMQQMEEERWKYEASRPRVGRGA